jgi:drug/metabolite transporter (DMT)-like permease
MPAGELAALATSLSWCFTGLLFAEAARRIGALRVNLLRLPAAIVMLSAAMLLGGVPLGVIPADQLGLLAVSGFIGLAVGDLAFFGALKRLGPRLALLLLSLAPIVSAGLGLVLLGERLSPLALAGIVVTLAGVMWVVSERPAGSPGNADTRGGVMLGLAAAVCQGTGLVIAKLGMTGGVSPMAAAWVRLAAATVLIWGAVVATGRHRSLAIPASLRRAGGHVAGGAFFGPFLGMWLSLVAASLTSVGVAATIMATNPVLVIPAVALLESYRPTARALLGTVATVAGIAILFLV